MRIVILAALLLGTALGARAQSTATLRGVDVYRSAVLTPDNVHARFDERLQQYVQLRNAATPLSLAKAEALRRAMEKEAASLPGVAWAELHASEYFTSVDHALYAVFDVVDQADASRLVFAPAPKAAVPDPDGLLAAWRKYVADGQAVSASGQMNVDSPNCPGFYCLWGGTPELDAAQTKFVAGAAAKKGELRRVLREDADGGARSAALFVLSYSTSGAEVVELCREAVSDSDPRVRGAALSILSDIANRHSNLAIALNSVLPRLDDPAFGVRGKAMGLLVPLAERKAYREDMLRSAPRIAALLRVAQPEAHDLAFTLLGIVSKKNYDREDYASWDAWAASAAAGKP
jgi:HEAT repeat protein